jgi:hypothetical protein
MRHFLFPAIGLLAMTLGANAAEFQSITSKDPKLAWKTVTLPNGATANYTHGIGSAAFRHPGDPDNVIWTAGDRGPNMTCAESEKLLGKETADKCRTLRNGRVYPTPDYSPTLYKIEIDRDGGAFKVLDAVTVKTKSGRPVTGLLNPQTKATKDTGMDLAGNVLPDDPDNIDLEGIVRLSDGTFWIGEEMGPSVAQLSADGRILRRFVPADAAADYAKSEAEIIPSLPAILSKRQGNRGIEGIAISPDEQFLYFMVQNPLANPDAKAYQQARNTRVFKMERASGKLVGEYVYQLDDPKTFALDPSANQSDPRISEVTALGTDRMLIDERTDGTTKLYEISLGGATNILGTPWDDLATAPSLELQNDVAKINVMPVTKTLRFDSARDFKDAPTKIEGLTFLGDGTLGIINDNDFGLRGDATVIVLAKGVVQPDPAVFKK